MRKECTSITPLEREAIMRFVDGNFTFTTDCLSGMLSRGLVRANVMESLANGDIIEYIFEGNKSCILVKSRMKFSNKNVLVTLQLKSREIVSVAWESERDTPNQSEYSSKLDIIKNLSKHA
ncbi:hypothetical protein P4V86_03210 [Brevibacillus laterosporus]|uniref:hypothetical protein n=1 Tax=Brevibacillus laterosporus TaxID=1465 RepID=UPI00037A1367|nr:hypothetical protein [Brevibacillus laterosporus]ATO48532.1 hypothetical protein BrL25_05045 [Brevibacillus laterosporus DSM 25]MED2002366.1 hypothetical protein [Brevibacillus laterosporus]